MKIIYGKELKVGDMLKTWYSRHERVQEIVDKRITPKLLDGKTHEVVTAKCTNGYNITIFLNENNIEIEGV